MANSPLTADWPKDTENYLVVPRYLIQVFLYSVFIRMASTIVNILKQKKLPKS